MGKRINELHHRVFDFLEEYRASHPDFYYFLRQKNNKKRLEEGLWFQGTEDYVFVGLYDRSGGTNRTKSFGFVFRQNGEKITCSIENAFNDETDESIISFYNEAREIIGGFELNAKTRYEKILSENDTFNEAANFLNIFQPQVDQLIKERKLEKLFITKEFFNQMLGRILEYQNNDNNLSNTLLVNITWNSNDWKTISDDPSNHGWVIAGNTPHESWNFDFDNPRNPSEQVFGYAQFTHPPRVKGNNNLIIFHSDGKIIGFYGKAEILHDSIKVNENESYNLIGQKKLSLVLNTKLDNIKAKGYLEDKERMGQIGFIYLKQKDTAIRILNEAITLNPHQKSQIEKIKNWLTEKQEPTDNSNNTMETKLNQILFGPPGTGKTFQTINEALKIADPEFYNTNKDKRDILKKRFKELLITDWDKTTGQIVFCTFHQSFSYEDFVEGIKPLKPKEEDQFIRYDIIPGVFKNICTLSNDYETSKQIQSNPLVTMTEFEFNKAIFYKLSLGDSQDPNDDEIYEYCIKNNCISIGFGEGADFSNLSESEITEKCNQLNLGIFHGQALNAFIHYMKPGNYVIIGKGNNYVRALGKIKGPYQYKPESPIRYKNFREVEWIFKDENIPINDVYDRKLSQMTIYKMDERGIHHDFFVKTPKPVLDFENKLEKKEEKKFVLIIDEINRGNISSIFGELITLIEKDKRAGAKEELEVILPYSKESFKVPGNVYIIGTMNTADRSIEALDTALRRRFSFSEIAPDPELIRKEGKLAPSGRIGDIDVAKMLEAINFRIEKLIDKDHKIGHAYFLHIKNNKQALEDLFADKIIPLLEEYFFGDFGKIGLVLGESFVEKVNMNGFDFAPFPVYGEMVSDLKEKSVYRIKSKDQWDFTSIYQTKVG